MAFIDFEEVKSRVSIEQAVKLLNLETKPAGHQLRAACPACKGPDRSLVITPAKNLFYCFTAKTGGDQIALVAHINGVNVQEAAQLLSGTVKATVPQPEKGQFKPLDYLEAEHLAVEAVGFDAETAKALGIGFAPRGIMAGLVAVPVRLEDGTLAGYIGITEAKLPKAFHLIPTNVVSFPKRTA
jgi:DNA primase